MRWSHLWLCSSISFLYPKWMFLLLFISRAIRYTSVDLLAIFDCYFFTSPPPKPHWIVAATNLTNNNNHGENLAPGRGDIYLIWSGRGGMILLIFLVHFGVCQMVAHVIQFNNIFWIVWSLNVLQHTLHRGCGKREYVCPYLDQERLDRVDFDLVQCGLMLEKCQDLCVVGRYCCIPGA